MNHKNRTLELIKAQLRELEYDISCILADLVDKNAEAQKLRDEIAQKTNDYQFNPLTASFEEVKKQDAENINHIHQIADGKK